MRELLGSEVEELPVFVVDVVAVSGCDLVSSLKELPPPSDAALAAGAPKPETSSTSTTHAQRDRGRVRDMSWQGLNTSRA